MDDLLSILSRERRALEALLFRLVEARGLLAAGETRFLSWAAADMAQAAQAVREVEARRVAATTATLRELVTESAEPLSSLLDDHRMALARLAGEVGAATDAVQEIGRARLDRLRQAVPAGCGGHLSAIAARDGGRGAVFRIEMDELDREVVAAGYESLLSASDALGLPALVGFLA